MKLCLLIGLSCLIVPSLTWQPFESGCSNSIPSFRLAGNSVHGCSGYWKGHIKDSGHICSKGWHVCSWQDQSLLKNISWNEAISVEGCYAYNAAQDGATCRECVDNIEADDLAGIGRGCPHQLIGQGSCIGGGQISASCCLDSHYGRACEFRHGLATGVLCCKQPGVSPVIHRIQKPHIVVESGQQVTLSCDPTVAAAHRVVWFKNKTPIKNSTGLISSVNSGKLLIAKAMPFHSGKYRCLMTINDLEQREVITKVTVIDRQSGCADGTKEGLKHIANIRTCHGAWSGHIKNANKRCGVGWHICGINDISMLKGNYKKIIKNETPGCFGMDVSLDSKGHCQECRSHGYVMAAIGLDCPRQDQSTSFSCLKDVITEIRRARHHGNCVYLPKVTSGAMCCRNRKTDICHNHMCHHNRNKKTKGCHHPCLSGGRCKHGRCHCTRHHHGRLCQYNFVRDSSFDGAAVFRGNSN